VRRPAARGRCYPCRQLDPLAANGSVAPIAPDPAATLRTIRALRDEDFDVVHLHEPLVPGCTMTALLYRAAPLVGTFHLAGESAAYRYLSPFTRRFVKRLSVRCAVSQEAAQFAAKALGGEYDVLFNGVELDRFDRATASPTDGPTILFVGRHEERKGLVTLLTAMQELPPETRLWVAGTGPQTAELQGRFRDPRVTWLGRIDDVELARRWKAASAYCAPSLGGESFGVVLLEAMAAGAPVVASDIPGYRQVARHEVDALLVPPGDAPALATALRRVLSDDRLAADLRRNGRDRAAGYSMATLAERYEEHYLHLVR
jgi:phosphatidyl-myo-inositol alpha-mannosyltransferase